MNNSFHSCQRVDCDLVLLSDEELACKNMYTYGSEGGVVNCEEVQAGEVDRDVRHLLHED